MSRYIPPALRHKTEPTESDLKTGSSASNARTTYSKFEIERQYDIRSETGTLNGTNGLRGAQDGDTESVADGYLTHILIFKGAHPEWPPKIYCKTNLDLLKRYESANDSSEKETENPQDDHMGKDGIPTFVQVPRIRNNFTFDGFYSIEKVEYYEPWSEELIHILEKKFTFEPDVKASSKDGDGSKDKDGEYQQAVTEDADLPTSPPSQEELGAATPRGKARAPEKWKESLSKRWAVVTLYQTERQGECPIKKKSVNEMLREMRVK